MGSEPDALVIVTGMQREARLFSRGGRVVVSGGDNSTLAKKIEDAIADGACAIISAGICGGLAPQLAIGTLVIAESVVWHGKNLPTDAAWNDALSQHLPDAERGAIAGTDKAAADPDAKSALYRKTGAMAVDMESHIAARIAQERGLPFAALRAVSDAATDALPPAANVAIGPNGEVRLAAVLHSVAGNPAQIPGLIRTARNTDQAMAELLRGLHLVGIGFACPYIG